MLKSVTGAWNEPLIRSSFIEEEANAILGIPSVGSRLADSCYWHYNSKGVFSVKSGCWLLVQKVDNPSSSYNAPAASIWWRALWRLGILPKVKLFVWRSCHGWHPTAAGLAARKVPVGGDCKLCHRSFEMVFHALWGYRKHKLVQKNFPSIAGLGNRGYCFFLDFVLDCPGVPSLQDLEVLRVICQALRERLGTRDDRTIPNSLAVIGVALAPHFVALINSLEDAHHQIDAAIAACLKESKPVYISFSCNLVAVPHFTFIQKPIPLFFSSNTSDEVALEAALEATAEILNNAVKPVMVAGPKLFVSKACESFLQLGDACGYAVAVLPSAKGLIPENHPKFIGTYWGCISTAFCAEIVETADASLFVGPVLDDISSLGNSLLFKKDKAIIIEPQRVLIPNGPIFRCVLMKDFLKALAQRLKNNATAYDNYKRIYVPEALPNTNTCDSEEALRIIVLFKHIQKMLLGNMAVIAETGDSWFLCQKLRLPQGCRHENQLLYASTGWSVGATLGYAQAAPDKRVIACIGDGSFQVYCEKELVVAIESAMTDKKDSLCFIEVIVHRDDSNKEFLQLGSRLAAANGRI
ncbi:hypothetical protein ACOSQ4_029606 [Xanthoceras sorbifolium]